MKDDSYIAGHYHKTAQFWWGVLIGTCGGFIGCIPWEAAIEWHLLVAALAGTACGICSRRFGDRFWYALIRMLRLLWHW